MEKPTLPKGTRDFGPAVMAKRQFILENIKKVFQKFGFLPLETPAMENLSTLTGKYGDEGDQLLFKILNSGDYLKNVDQAKLKTQDSRLITPDISEKGLRYDLTVPFARYVVMNRHEIAFPFKRYQVQPVWRADRPQKGRYREFYQCDADVVGTTSLVCEAEIILMIKEVMQNLGVTDYTIKINHRAILNGIAAFLDFGGKEQDLFVAMDKLDKLGQEKVKEELLLKGMKEDSIDALFLMISPERSISKKIQDLAVIANHVEGKKGQEDIKTIIDLLTSFGSDTTNVVLDVSLARGLSYYTGCIFEVKINNVGIGSVSGGGRYDNLTASFGDKENLSGVGFSFGVDRLYDSLEELNLFPKETSVSSKILVCHFDDEAMRFGLKALSTFRKAGIASEIYPDQSKLKKQLDYANKKLIPFTVVIGSDEMQKGMLTFKNMESGEQEKLTIEQIIQKLKT
jgi:histidyl-tRNA synthetase